jgi:alpha-tubulin suppressor-like RCC1 family protein
MYAFNRDNQLRGPLLKEIDPQLLVNAKSVCRISNSYLVLKTDGSILSWGKNGCGVLGLGHKDPVHVPRVIPDLPVIKLLACGDGFCVAVDENGDVWGWGCNDAGQLGWRETRYSYQNQVRPIRIHLPSASPDSRTIVQIACGIEFSAALSQTGQVWIWGSFETDPEDNSIDVPKIVDHLKNIKSISCVNDVGLALDESGTVWTFGYHPQGQIVKPLMKNIAIICCKEPHILVDQDGQVWTCDNDDICRVTQVTTLPKIVDLAVDVNDDHVLALDESGVVWLSDTVTSNGPTRLELPDNEGPYSLKRLEDVRVIKSANSMIS